MKAFIFFTLLVLLTDDYDTWHQQRIESLKSEEGWLNLAGLFWLKEGENSFGSDQSNTIVFPYKAPKTMGILTLENGKVRFKSQNGVNIQWINSPSTPDYVFENGKTITMQHRKLSVVYYQTRH
ncbi:MAG: hypothetical protein R2822_09955 [Spirosomataceae bacterium]